jgi:hypothetical protein
MDQGIAAINEQVKRESEFVRVLVGEIGKVIVGQRCLIEARFAPLPGSTVHFKLAQGTAVSIKEDRGEWLFIERAASRAGSDAMPLSESGRVILRPLF